MTGATLLRYAVLAAGGWLHAAAVAWPLHSLWTYGQNIWYLQVAAMLVLAQQLHSAPTARAAWWRSWFFASVYLASTFWWLFTAMHTYGGMAAPLAAAAELLLAVLLAIYFALASVLWWQLAGSHALRNAVLFGLLWMAAELARGTWLTGFGWGAGGYAHLDGPLAPFAPWLGAYGMGALAAMVAMAMAQSRWMRSSGRAQSSALGRSAWAGLLLALALPSLVPARWASWTQDKGSLSVTVLQGGIAQSEKFDSNTGVGQALRWYQQHLLESHSALVVAPETAIPLLPEDLPADYWERLSTGLVTQGRAAIIGIPLGDSSAGYTNSVIALLPGEKQVLRYDKHHLVPFGEFIPPMLRWFTNLMHIPLGDFRRGALGQSSFALQGQGLAAHICYEDLFGEELATRFGAGLQAPTVLVNVSNLAWFGPSIALDQHLGIARMRTLEFQLPMVRATNTGASALIDHRGVVFARLPYTVAGVLEGEVQGRIGTTPFAWWASRWGLWPLWLAVVAGLLWALLAPGRTGAARRGIGP